MAESDFTTSGETVRDDSDSCWKEAIETYFKEFVLFFFPTIYDEVDLERGYEFLDKELEKAVRKSKIGKRFADKLVKVYLKDGAEKWLLIHIEVQGYYDTDFVKRMFIYYYRIFDRYDREVISLAILSDENQNYRPCRYEISRWGFRLLFEFPIIKLIDYNDRAEELEASHNPFGIITAAYLKGLATKKDSHARYTWKLSMVKALYNKGYSRDDIKDLYRFIDWLIVLPEGLENKFQDEINALEEEKKVDHITSFERTGIEKGLEQGLQKGIQKGLEQGLQKGLEQGLQKGIQKGLEQGLQKGRQEGLLEAISLGLELKFGNEGLQLYEQISRIYSIEQLERIKETIRTAASCKEIEVLILK